MSILYYILYTEKTKNERINYKSLNYNFVLIQNKRKDVSRNREAEKKLLFASR